MIGERTILTGEKTGEKPMEDREKKREDKPFLGNRRASGDWRRGKRGVFTNSLIKGGG